MIELSLSENQTLVIESSVVTLRGTQPILNGVLLDDWACEILQLQSDHMEFRYTSMSLGGGTFRLQVTLSNSQHIWMRYWVEGLPPDLVLDSFGLRFEQVENVRQFLRNGYFSWDGSYYIQPDTLLIHEGNISYVETGYGMCQFLPRYGSGSLILGFDRHDRFQQTFTLDMGSQPLALTIQTWWDRKDHSDLERCESEQLVVLHHAEVENGLREWARIAANSSLTPPRLSAPPITGWCSWYNLYAYINEENIHNHLHAAETVTKWESLPNR